MALYRENSHQNDNGEEDAGRGGKMEDGSRAGNKMVAWFVSLYHKEQ